MNRIRGRILQRIRDYYFAQYPWCVSCLSHGKKVLATQLDHIVPLFKGGKDEDDNRQGLCDQCHDDKTREDLGWKQSTACDSDGNPLNSNHHWNK